MSKTQDKKPANAEAWVPASAATALHNIPSLTPFIELCKINGLFDRLFTRNGPSPKIIAVGCSGGPDSMALTHMLGRWAAKHGRQIHALIVDHGLRANSSHEAQQAHRTLSGFNHVTPFILRWENGANTVSAIQENARNARYALMAAHCAAHDIPYLCTAHHMDDQAETMLFRLAKGTGLEGLAGIRQTRPYDNQLTLVRPLLDTAKADLLAYCTENDIPYVSDPSNEKDMFARVRLRRSYEALSAEGLTPERLGTTANRLRRAGEALDLWAKESFNAYLIEQTEQRIVLSSDLLKDRPEDIIIRILGLCIEKLSDNDKPYPPRLSRVETIARDLLYTTPFKARTLAGLKFSIKNKKTQIIIEQL